MCHELSQGLLDWEGGFEERNDGSRYVTSARPYEFAMGVGQ